MEFAYDQILALNAKMPRLFKIDRKISTNTRHRKTEAEKLQIGTPPKEPTPPKKGKIKKAKKIVEFDGDTLIYNDLPQEQAPNTRKKSLRSKKSHGSEEDSSSVSNEPIEPAPTKKAKLPKTPPTKSPPTGRKTAAFNKIKSILQQVIRHPMAEPFRNPLNINESPDYFKKVKEPIDLSTIEAKLNENKYETGYQFAIDMRLLWSNSFLYYAKGSDTYHMTVELSSLFEKLIKGNESLVLTGKKDIVKDLYHQVETLTKEIQGSKIKIEENPPKPKQKAKPANEKPMTLIEKKKLCLNIKSLNPKYLRGVLDIVKKCMDVNGKEFQFDVENLPTAICRELEKYVKACLKNESPNKSKANGMNREDIERVQRIAEEKLKHVDMKIEELTRVPQQVENIMKKETEDEIVESSSTSESESEDEIVPPMQDIGLIPPNKEDSESLPRASDVWNSLSNDLADKKPQNSASDIVEIN
ncbi:BRDT_8 [Blepharisma stoltei]|uniref:Bromodomain testis-specific protein n=1 Tax=Blepharisma stoltei TaxID=1481888 RepID=A0AAU9K8D8_9CILI|nr:unnamed protein product [Blepharisma stoltei]